MKIEMLHKLTEEDLCKLTFLQNLIEEHGGVHFSMTKYKRKLNYLIADCPFHTGDAGKCLSIAYDKEGQQYFNCFACGRHGNAVDFILEQLKAHYEKPAEVERVDAIDALRDYLEVFLERGLNEHS